MNTSTAKPHHLAIFASGNGSNAQQICEYFAHHPLVDVACIIYNRKDAFVANRAKAIGVEAFYFSNVQITQSSDLEVFLSQRGVTFIVLAGFLSLIPARLLDLFPHAVVNIHPSLLPLHGGKGMFGMRVHQAVIEAGELQSGISIHLVNQHYDDGSILFQAKCSVSSTDTPESLAEKIHLLEKQFFPPVIESFILGTPMPSSSVVL